MHICDRIIQTAENRRQKRFTQEDISQLVENVPGAYRFLAQMLDMTIQKFKEHITSEPDQDFDKVKNVILLLKQTTTPFDGR